MRDKRKSKANADAEEARKAEPTDENKAKTQAAEKTVADAREKMNCRTGISAVP